MDTHGAWRRLCRVIGLTTHRTLNVNAYREVLEQAGLMMDSVIALCGHTIDEIRLLLAGDIKSNPFFRKSCPPARRHRISQCRTKKTDYAYKEATLNPTRPRNRGGGAGN